jgi:hypothetical protein
MARSVEWIDQVTERTTTNSKEGTVSTCGATVMYGAHNERVETVPDAGLVEPTDALVRVTRACICGSDLWPYNSMPPSDTGNRMRRNR